MEYRPWAQKDRGTGPPCGAMVSSPPPLSSHERVQAREGGVSWGIEARGLPGKVSRVQRGAPLIYLLAQITNHPEVDRIYEVYEK